MHIKLIVAAAAIALIAGVGSVSADELSVADTANDTEAPFAMLDGIATEQMSVQELAETRGEVFGSTNIKTDYAWPNNDSANVDIAGADIVYEVRIQY